MRISGKVVLITGASEGIGAACAREFAAAGARLSLTARKEEGLRRAAPPDALIASGDITVDLDRRRVVERTLERFGAIDILINNAGVGIYQPSWEMPMEEARYLMELNFFAPLAMTQLVAPHMRSRHSGFLVNVGSIGGKVVLPWMTLYSVTKSALGALTEGQRMELMRAMFNSTMAGKRRIASTKSHPERGVTTVRASRSTPRRMARAHASGVMAKRRACWTFSGDWPARTFFWKPVLT